MSRASDEVRQARAYLCCVAEPPVPALAAFVGHYGPLAAAARVRENCDLPPAVERETHQRHDRLRGGALLERASAIGARLLVPEDTEEWPARAFEAFRGTRRVELRAPLALWARGPASLPGPVGIAVVGSRAATGYGCRVASGLASGLAEYGYAVISSASFGVNAAAHRGALAAGGITVAVLPCGLDRPYPTAHARLLEEIAGTGLVISEYPAGAAPVRPRFVARQRIVAGLSAATVVVEAGVRSGSVSTALDAADLGRPVMAVPGPVTSAQSTGSHRLVRHHGAALVTNAAEVIDEITRARPDTNQ